MRTIKLSQYAKENAVTYQTVFSWYQKGLLKGVRKLPTGKLVIDVENSQSSTNENNLNVKVALYARTSSSQNKKLLSDQLARLESYAAAKGYTVIKSVKEFGSGLSDTRDGLASILKTVDKYDKIIVEHRDRLSRFGFGWFQLFARGKIEVINESKSDAAEITEDLISIIHCFAAKMYGLRRKKRKLIETIKSETTNECDDTSDDLSVTKENQK
jgi:predicted site-specific integrase-resolvase